MSVQSSLRSHHSAGPRVLYHGRAVILGETRLDAGDASFRREAVADVWPSVAFPRVPLGIRAADVPPVFGDANTAILFSVGRPYSRISIDGHGSWTEWIEIRPDILAEMVASLSEGGAPSSATLFASGSSPAPPATHLALRRALVWLSQSGVADALVLEESALSIVHEVLAAGLAAGPDAPLRPDSRDVVFDVRAILNRRLGDPLSLADISDAIGVSPYHLCRMFRRHTGVPIHRYRDRLRLFASLDMIVERNDSLLDIALALGYANEAHFSDAFRRTFGMRPGAYRRAVRETRSKGGPR